MPDAYHELLDATIQHLEQLKRQGNRLVTLEPASLQKLSQPVVPKPRPARTVTSQIPPSQPAPEPRAPSVVATPAPRATKVEVLSPQPVGSYELRTVDGKVELHILDPVEFRKVKHLVIMTKA